MHSMLDIGIIKNDERQAVHCRTLDEAVLFFNAVKEQRPDIRLYGWHSPPEGDRQADKAYILSYRGCKSLKFGEVASLKREGIQIMAFDELISFNLPEPEVNQTGILSLLGL